MKCFCPVLVLPWTCPQLSGRWHCTNGVWIKSAHQCSQSSLKIPQYLRRMKKMEVVRSKCVFFLWGKDSQLTKYGVINKSGKQIGMRRKRRVHHSSQSTSTSVSFLPPLSLSQPVMQCKAACLCSAVPLYQDYSLQAVREDLHRLKGSFVSELVTPQYLLAVRSRLSPSCHSASSSPQLKLRSPDGTLSSPPSQPIRVTPCTLWQDLEEVKASGLLISLTRKEIKLQEVCSKKNK